MNILSKGWRPDNWADILKYKTEEWNNKPPAWTFDNFIEFGADAMLEAVMEHNAKSYPAGAKAEREALSKWGDEACPHFEERRKVYAIYKDDPPLKKRLCDECWREL